MFFRVKNEESKEIQDQTAKFLANGGKVHKITKAEAKEALEKAAKGIKDVFQKAEERVKKQSEAKKQRKKK
jgi:hypothetical protein